MSDSKNLFVSDEKPRDVVYRTDDGDRFLWDQFLEDCSSQADDTAEIIDATGRDGFSGVPSFARETFARAFSSSERERVGAQPVGQEAWQTQAHEALLQLPEWKMAKALVEGNDVAAGAFALDFTAKLLATLPEPPEPTGDDDADEAAAQAYADGMTDGKGATQLRTALRKAVESGQEAAEQAMAYGRLPGTDGGNPTRSDRNKIAVMMKRAKEQPKLKKIAEAAGRLRAICTRVRKYRTKRGAEEIHGVEQGNAWARLLPTEWADLAAGGGRQAMALLRVNNMQALQYATRGRQKETRGPIVVLCDGSGSMAGDREAWAKGFAMAMLDLARSQKRPFLFAQFDSNVHSDCAIEFDGVSGPSFDTLLDAMCFFPGGGTDFDTTLTYGFDAIDRIASLKKADVVLITDGECGISAAVKERVKKANASLISILIDPWEGSQFIDLKEICAKTLTVTPTHDGDAHGLFLDIGGE